MNGGEEVKTDAPVVVVWTFAGPWSLPFRRVPRTAVGHEGSVPWDESVVRRTLQNGQTPSSGGVQPPDSRVFDYR